MDIGNVRFFKKSITVIVIIIFIIFIVSIVSQVILGIEFIKFFTDIFIDTLAIFIAIIIFVLGFEWQKWERMKNLFKSLYEEIKLNQEKIEHINIDKIVSEAEPLYTLSYENIRRSDELLILSKKLRKDLDKVYLLIYIHNHSYYGLRGLFEDILKKLEPLTLYNEKLEPLKSYNECYDELDCIIYKLFHKSLKEIGNKSLYDRLCNIYKILNKLKDEMPKELKFLNKEDP